MKSIFSKPVTVSALAALATMFLFPLPMQASDVPTLNIQSARVGTDTGGSSDFRILLDMHGFVADTGTSYMKFAVCFLDDEGNVGLVFVPGIALPGSDPSTVVIMDYDWSDDYTELSIAGNFSAFTPTTVLVGVQNVLHEPGNFIQASLPVLADDTAEDRDRDRNHHDRDRYRDRDRDRDRGRDRTERAERTRQRIEDLTERIRNALRALNTAS